MVPSRLKHPIHCAEMEQRVSQLTDATPWLGLVRPTLVTPSLQPQKSILWHRPHLPQPWARDALAFLEKNQVYPKPSAVR